MKSAQQQRDALRERKTQNKRDQRARIVESGKVEKTFAIIDNQEAFDMVARSVKRANNKYK